MPIFLNIIISQDVISVSHFPSIAQWLERTAVDSLRLSDGGQDEKELSCDREVPGSSLGGGTFFVACSPYSAVFVRHYIKCVSFIYKEKILRIWPSNLSTDK